LRRGTGKLSGSLRLPRGGDLRIGDISIQVNAPFSATLRTANPLYRSFLQDRSAAAPTGRMSVRLRGDGWPSMQDAERVFDTRDSWVLFRDPSGYWLRLDRPGSGEPLWVARFKSGVGRVDLYCRFGSADARGHVPIDLPLTYPLDQLLLMHYFAGRKGLLTHAAGWVYKGKAYLFAGASGAGKSTISELLVKARAGKMLSDERMIVREIRGKMIAFGTPWAGTAGIARAGQAPLAGIFFLKHGKANRCEKLDAAQAADRLLPMISTPWYDPDTAAPIIAFARRVCSAVPGHEFRFTPDGSAIDFIRDFIGKTT